MRTCVTLTFKCFCLIEVELFCRLIEIQVIESPRRSYGLKVCLALSEIQLHWERTILLQTRNSTMFSMELILMFVTALLSGLYLHNKFKYRNFPKGKATTTSILWCEILSSICVLGPMGLPIIGYLPFLGPTPHRRYSELAKTYGNIFSLMFGQLPWVFVEFVRIERKTKFELLYRVVVLNDLETIKKAFRHDVFSGRPNKQVLAMGIVKGGTWVNLKFSTVKFNLINRLKGMTFSDGKDWAEQRRFTLKILKSLGFGKSSLEGSVKEECSRLLRYFK